MIILIGFDEALRDIYNLVFTLLHFGYFVCVVTEYLLDNIFNIFCF